MPCIYVLVFVLGDKGYADHKACSQGEVAKLDHGQEDGGLVKTCMLTLYIAINHEKRFVESE
jgi:hypothetical protein